MSYLKELRDNDYCNKEAVIDYVPEEVDNLIWTKQNKIDEKSYVAQMKEQDEYALHLQKQNKKKVCSRCKIEKSFDNFHNDKSKKAFGLRSHCLKCRGIKNEIKHCNPRDLSV